MSSPHLPALRDERRAVLEFCADLTDADLAATSAAPGWSIADVLVHITTITRAVITPASVPYMTTRNVEALNEQLVDERRAHGPGYAIDEFATWSRRATTALTMLTTPGPKLIRVPLGELGWYPLSLTPAILLFEWHTHLRYDIAPALDRPTPATDARRMAALLTWLTAQLERSHREALGWLDAVVALTLGGPGGGTWLLDPRGGRLRVRPGEAVGAATHIAALSLEFPQWSTRRVPWRACEVTVTGDVEVGTRVLDSINLL